MSDVDTTIEKSEEKIDGLEHETVLENSMDLMRDSLRRVVLFISFGPGVLGFLWLIGRILKR